MLHARSAQQRSARWEQIRQPLPVGQARHRPQSEAAERTPRGLADDVVAQAFEGGGNQIRLRSNVYHGFDARRQGAVDRVHRRCA